MLLSTLQRSGHRSSRPPLLSPTKPGQWRTGGQCHPCHPRTSTGSCAGGYSRIVPSCIPKKLKAWKKGGVRTLFKDVQRLSDSKSQVRPVIIAAIASSCCRAFAEQLCSMSSTSRGFKAHGRLPNSGSKLPCQVDVGLVALELSDMTPCHSKEIDGNRIFKCPMLGGTDGLSN